MKEKAIFVVTLTDASGHARIAIFTDRQTAELKAARYSKMAGCAASALRQIGEAA